MNFFRDPIAIKYVALVVALQVFNCSVDPPDREPDGSPEDLQFNDMESVLEIVLEKVFHIENALAEQDEPDNPPGGLAAKTVVYLITAPVTQAVLLSRPVLEKRVALPTLAEDLSGRSRPEPQAPPPKA
jgi:hypothetical protein